MAEIEEPQFTSLQARIAALNNQGMGKSANTHTASFGKRPPPPLPTSRPAATRTQTTNNPPIVTYGSSVTAKASNQPIGVKGQPLLPPPPIDRDQPQSSKSPNSKVSLLAARNVPPPLPGRKTSQPAPSLPLRNNAPSQAMARRGSNSSTISHSSTVSGLSLSQTSSSNFSSSSVESPRKLPPALGEANLPPLPPSRRDQEEKAKEAKKMKIPLVTVKSAPVIPIRGPPPMDRDLLPPLPQRPKVPSRSSSTNLEEEEARPSIPPRPTSRDNLAQEERAPAQPPRRLPPVGAGRKILSLGFNNKQTNTMPSPSPRPISTYNTPTPAISARPAVQQLTDRNFDNVIAGKYAFVDFYAPYCKYCVKMEPAWKQLAETFAFASDNLVIAKVDVNDHKSFLSRYDIQGYPTLMFFDGRSETPETYPYSRELAEFTNFLEERTGIAAKNGDKTPIPQPNAVPPPVNLSTKPSPSSSNAVQSHPPPFGCMVCRDFSAPDRVASQYPRQSLPRSPDITGYLASVLCGPFISRTDKARAIFTWLHHNVAYDTAAFFGNRVKHVDPQDTIASGAAVCGGYAGVFSAIALKAGLEAVMVTGHGKGYGHNALQPGEAIPPCKPDGHAWNAVRIDDGEWKLLDACWGAGSVNEQAYIKHFKPSFFTMSNEDFGKKHFPADDKHFFTKDARPMSWEQYMLGPSRTEPLQLFGNVESDHGLSSTSFTPAQKSISVNTGETIRFQFSKACEHWDNERNGTGKMYLMLLKISGVDGRKEDYVVFESNEFWWWCDVNAKDLGAPGQTVSVYTVETVSGKNVRGMSGREYLQKKGRCGMTFGVIAAWNLV